MKASIGMYVCICTLTILYFLDEPLDLLTDYYKKFGHKQPCCFHDTHGFVTKLLSTADADKVGVASLFIVYVCTCVECQIVYFYMCTCTCVFTG